jgi:hypothetical protein
LLRGGLCPWHRCSAQAGEVARGQPEPQPSRGTLKRPPGQQGHRQSPRLRLRIWERRSASERRLEQSAFTGTLPTSSNIFQPGHQSFLLAIARMVVSCCEALDLRCSHWIVWTATVRSLL